MSVLGDIDSLLEWCREAEAGLREAEPPSSEANIIRLQLKEHRALSDDIASQRGRVRDVLVTAKKVLSFFGYFSVMPNSYGIFLYTYFFLIFQFSVFRNNPLSYYLLYISKLLLSLHLDNL